MIPGPLAVLLLVAGLALWSVPLWAFAFGVATVAASFDRRRSARSGEGAGS